jgi:transcription elongation factor Elf1
MCPITLFRVTVPGQWEHEKLSVEVTCPVCSHENLMACVEQSKALSRKAKPIVFVFKATKTSETTK